ncbi:MAG: choice-of-anchor D domain-containing protein [Pseudomonadota bacterium]|nr:choice-of-anchor D domain-containing protein [Pseudomonadota bacterium]
MLLLLLLACPGSDKADTATDPVCTPAVDVSPTELDFGEVEVGASSTRSVTVTSSGCEALEIHGLDLVAADAPFHISAIGAVLIPPGSSTTFSVTFRPATATDTTADILLSTNDPEHPETTLPLEGTGVAR